MKSSINPQVARKLKWYVVAFCLCLAMLLADDRVQAAPCIDLSDIPLDALEQEAPGMIMFVLDDSGSMDWEIMTPPTSGEGGLFDGMEYVFSDPGDDVYGWRENIEDFGSKS